MTRLIISMTTMVLGLVQAALAQPVVRPATSEPTRSVTLSLAEYNRLMDRANQIPPNAAPPPVGAVLSTADLRVRVEGNIARGSFTLAGEVLRAGVNRINLVSGATILDATASGQALPLVVDGAVHAALVSGPGPFAAALEWATPLTFRPGRALFVLPVPSAGTARATFDIPGEDADVNLSAGWITRRASQNGRTSVEAALDPGTATEVSWSMRDSAPIAAARELRLVADVMTLLTLGDSDARMAALVEITVVQGEPRTVEVRLPAGYELTGVAGNSLETSEPRDSSVLLTLADPALRRHEFLVTLERPHAGGSFALETELIAVANVQRERGEIAIEGVGTLDLTAAETPGMQRIDVRELNVAVRSLARMPIMTGFRYQRTPTYTPGLTLTVARFADAGVLAAAVDRAEATTLVTVEGRALTEVKLLVQNRAQPFLKVTLPEGASIVSMEVDGQTAKPVLGSDGTRLPLLRPGFRPRGSYEVSYVFLHAGAPFGRKGEIALSLPRMDIPVGVVNWEVFVPDNYSVRHVDGNAISQVTVERALRREADRAAKEAKGRRPTVVSAGVESGSGSGLGPGSGGGTGGGVASRTLTSRSRIVVSPANGDPPGTVRGRVVDPSGAVLAGATVTFLVGGASMSAVTGGDGTFLLKGVPPGLVTASAQLSGFVPQQTQFSLSGDARRLDIVMPIAGRLEETITVTGSTPVGDAQTASVNVVNLQRRAAGVLPIRVDVPRAGSSHRFSRPIVVDDETTVRFRYARR
jgi:hypothetical protein